MTVIPGGVPGQTAGARLAAEHVLGGGSEGGGGTEEGRRRVLATHHERPLTQV